MTRPFGSIRNTHWRLSIGRLSIDSKGGSTTRSWIDHAIAINPNLAPAFFGRALASYQEKARWDFDAYLNEGAI
jgi:hypothetical protein